MGNFLRRSKKPKDERAAPKVTEADRAVVCLIVESRMQIVL